MQKKTKKRRTPNGMRRNRNPRAISLRESLREPQQEPQPGA